MKIVKDIDSTCNRYECMNNNRLIPVFRSEFEKKPFSKSVHLKNSNKRC